MHQKMIEMMINNPNEELYFDWFIEGHYNPYDINVADYYDSMEFILQKIISEQLFSGL